MKHLAPLILVLLLCSGCQHTVVVVTVLSYEKAEVIEPEPELKDTP